MTALRQVLALPLSAAVLMLAPLSPHVSPHVSSHAQTATAQDRQQTIDWFINKYYYPHAICAFANQLERTREAELLATIRKENLRAFEAAERAPEYAATIAKLQPLIDQRFRGKSNQAAATAECTHLTDQMVFAHKRKRHDALFTDLIKMFGPTN